MHIRRYLDELYDQLHRALSLGSRIVKAEAVVTLWYRLSPYWLRMVLTRCTSFELHYGTLRDVVDHERQKALSRKGW